METKIQGKILKLDPDKKYIMFVKLGSLLAKTVRDQGSNLVKDRSIIFVGNFDEFMFVENSEDIIDIQIKN